MLALSAQGPSLRLLKHVALLLCLAALCSSVHGRPEPQGREDTPDDGHGHNDGYPDYMHHFCHLIEAAECPEGTKCRELDTHCAGDNMPDDCIEFVCE